MSKIFFEDTSIVTIVCIDSEDRRRNVDLFMRYYCHHFDLPIYILEIGSNPTITIPEEFYQIKYTHHTPPHDVFRFNGSWNEVYDIARTKYILAIDIDCLVSPEAATSGLQEVISGRHHFAIPHNGAFYDVPALPEIIADISNIHKYPNITSFCNMGGPQSVGGAIIFEFNTWLSLGMENEKFTGWEFDDWERAARIEKFYPIHRDKNNQFICHMSHARPTQDTPLKWYGACSPNKWGDLNRLWRMQQGPELDQYINELKELINIKPIE